MVLVVETGVRRISSSFFLLSFSRTNVIRSVTDIATRAERERERVASTLRDAWGILLAAGPEVFVLIVVVVVVATG